MNRRTVIRTAVQEYDVKRADILTFAVALIIVSIIAAASQSPGGIAGVARSAGIPGFEIPAPSYENLPGDLPYNPLQEGLQVWTIPKNTNLNTVYVSGEGGYPVTDFPADMTQFGASDPEYANIWAPGEIVRFARYTGPGNGFSEMFPVAFTFWRVNATMHATVKPESAQLTWVLVDGETGTVLTGNQMRYGGSVQKTVQASGESFYFIVSARDVERYSLDLETTRALYGDTLIQPAVRRLTAFLNAA